MEIKEVKRVSELTEKYPRLNEEELKELRLLANRLGEFCADIIYEMTAKD